MALYLVTEWDKLLSIVYYLTQIVVVINCGLWWKPMLIKRALSSVISLLYHAVLWVGMESYTVIQ